MCDQDTDIMCTEDVKNENSCTHFFNCGDKEGRVELLHLFPGIDLYMLDTYAENLGSAIPPKDCIEDDIIVITHCKEGRFIGEYEDSEFIYLGEGDTSVNLHGAGLSRHSFPLSRYKGAVVVVRASEAQKSLKALEESLGAVPVDLPDMIKKLIARQNVVVYRSDEYLENMFSGIYDEGIKNREFFFRLRVLEIISAIYSHENVRPSDFRYFCFERVEAVRNIRKLLVENIDRKYTQSELSQMYSIPLTSLKECFKAVYGVPLNTYMRDYRIESAAKLLRETDFSVAEVAERVGYANQSKFAEVFKEKMGTAPMEYRNKFN